jgi:hypothetical protein
MTSTFVIAIWIASSSHYEAALPFNGEYRGRTFANSEQGIDEFVSWLQSSGPDKIDMYCVSISGAEQTSAAKFWRTSPARTVFFVNPVRVENYAKENSIKKITAETVAAVCAKMGTRAR